MKSTKRLNYLFDQCKKYDVPKDICYGIYFLETTYRNIAFRICENVVVILRIILNWIFRVPIKNYTIGCCQMGLSSILYFAGTDMYEHIDYIKRISIQQAVAIIKAMGYRHSIELMCKKVHNYYKNYSYLNKNDIMLSAVKIGELYNGKLIYGLQLQEFIWKLGKYHNNQFDKV